MRSNRIAAVALALFALTGAGCVNAQADAPPADAPPPAPPPLALGLIERLDPGDGIDPARAMAEANRGQWLWDADYLNRRNINGAIFYVNHPGGEFRVRMRFYSVGVGGARQGFYNDGKPQPLVLRVFDPRDRSVFASEIGQPEPGWYETAVNLEGQPAGRYRFSMNGWHEGIALATEPATPVGILGARTIGTDGPWEGYVYAPEGSASWSVRVHADRPGGTLAVLGPDGVPATEAAIRRAPRILDFQTVAVRNVPGGGVFHVRFEGDARCKVSIDGIAGIFWPTAEAARESAGDRQRAAGRWVPHAWQVPLAEWLASRNAADFALDVNTLPPIDATRLPDYVAIGLRELVGPNDLLATGRSLIEHNQIVDPASPDLGLFAIGPDAPRTLAGNPYGGPGNPLERYGQVGYVRTLAALLSNDAWGFNPWFNHPKLLNRVMAGAFQVLLDVPEDQIIPYGSFMEVRQVGLLAAMLHRRMPPELAEPLRAGLIETIGRCGYWDGFLSNQGLANLYGVKLVADVTGDDTLKHYYERELAALLAGQTHSPNHGQVAAGFYQEVGGFDGAYNTYSASILLRLWHMTHDPRIFASLERNFELVRHLAVTFPDGTFTSARHWNTRTNTMAFRWHNQRAGASIPGSATFWKDNGFNAEGGRDANAARAHIERLWGSTHGAVIEQPWPQWWGGGGATDGTAQLPPYAAPLPLGCEEPGPFVRAFGGDGDCNFLAGRIGPWYIVLYGGDTWRHGAPGSGLATLWREGLGPLIMGDTKLYNDWAKAMADADPPQEVMLALVDAWDHEAGGAAMRANTEKTNAALRGDAETGVFSARVRPHEAPWRLTRTYTLSAERVTSDATLEHGAFVNHALYLPLVAGPQVSLRAIDADGRERNLAIGETARVRGFRWRSAADPERVATLTFAEPVEVAALGESRPSGGRLNAHIKFFRVALGEASRQWVVE